jgi:hypothetical protein
LTCDFRAENGKEKMRRQKHSNKSVASPFGLRSGLRQSGSAFGAAFYGTAEAVPLSKAVLVGWKRQNRRQSNGAGKAEADLPPASKMT